MITDAILLWVESNPALVVALTVDVIMGFTVAKRVLHPYLGRFDIAYLLEPLGERDANPTKGAPAEGSTVEVQGQIMMVAGRIEFNPDRKMLTFGKGKDTETYRIEKPGDAKVKKPAKKKVKGLPAAPEGPEASPATLPGPGFLQWTHRVWFFRRGQAYPIHVSFGGPARTTSADAADKFVRLRFWEMAVRGARSAELKIPLTFILIYIALGAAISAALFFGVHPGFVPISSVPPQTVSSVSHSTSSTISTVIFNGNSTVPAPGGVAP